MESGDEFVGEGELGGEAVLRAGVSEKTESSLGLTGGFCLRRWERERVAGGIQALRQEGAGG